MRLFHMLALVGFTLFSLFSALLCAEAGSGERRQYEQPLIAVPTDGRPVDSIDGRVDDEEWRDASSVSGFINSISLDNGGARDFYRAEFPSTVWIKSDGEFLYLAFKHERRPGEELKALTPAGERDAALGDRDDVFELFLSPEEDVNIVFKGNSAGGMMDARRDGETGGEFDTKWSADWIYRTHVAEGYWSGEIKVALSEFTGSPVRSGDSWRLGLGRVEHGRVRTSWNYMGGLVGDADTYGTMLFAEGLAVRIQSVGHFVPSRAGAALELFNIGTDARKVDSSADIALLDRAGRHGIRLLDLRPGYAFEEETLYFDDYRSYKRDVEIPSGESRRVVFSKPVMDSKDLMIDYVIKEDGLVLGRGTVFHHEEPPSLFDVDKRYLTLTRGRIDIIIRGRTLAGAETVKLELERDGDVVFTEEKALDKGVPEDVVFRVDAGEHEAGEYNMAVETEAGREEMPFRIPALPEWYGNRVGISDKVPEPWQPIRVSAGGRRLDMWFKTFGFEAGGALPERVDVFGSPLLAETMRFAAYSEGRRYELEPVSFEMTGTSDRRINYKGVLSGGGLRAHVDFYVEFDGFSWFDVELTGCGEEIENFRLEIPLHADAGRFYKRTYEGRTRRMDAYDWRKRNWAGEIPEGGLNMGWCGAVWVGSPGGGIEWINETYQGWHLESYDKDAIEVEKNGDGTLLAVNFINKNLTLESPQKFSFGLTATPMRDNRKWGLFYRDIVEAGAGRFHQSMSVFEESRTAGEHERPARFAERGGRNLGHWFYNYPAPRAFSRGIAAVYPLAGNIREEEGAIEFLVRPEVEEPQGELDLMWLDTGENQGIKLFLENEDAGWDVRRPRVNLEIYHDNLVQPVTAHSDVLEPGPGGFLDIALTWECRGGRTELGVWHNGARAIEQTVAFGMSAIDFSDKYLFLGGDTQAVFDELHISGGGKPSPVAGRPRRAGARTLLLDRMDCSFVPNDYLQTRAEVISGQSAETGGWVDVFGSFVEGAFGGGLKLSVEERKTRLELARSYGVRVAYGRHIDRFSALWDTYGEELDDKARRWTGAADRAGMESMFYYAKLISPDDTYWEDFGHELHLGPLRTSINNYILCLQGHGEDYWVWVTAQMMERYNLGGLHIDYGSVMMCSHEDHGCGWRDEDGELHFRYPVRAHRRAYWRLYELCRGGGAGRTGPLKNHNSDGMPYAAIGMSDYMVSGEMENFIDREGEIGDWLGWDRYLTFYSERTTGVPLRTKDVPQVWPQLMGDGTDVNLARLTNPASLAWRENRLSPFRTGPKSKAGGAGSGTEYLYTPVFVDFAGGEIIGFWENRPHVRIFPEDDDYVGRYIKANLFIHPEEDRILLIVGNLGSEDRDIRIELDLEEWGIGSGAGRARCVYTRQVYSLDNLEIKSYKEDARMLIIRGVD